MEILARAVGRRKEAVAQVQLIRGNGQFLINGKPAQAYLQNNSCSLICIKGPLQAVLSLSSPNDLIDPLAKIEGAASPTVGEAALKDGLRSEPLDAASLDSLPVNATEEGKEASPILKLEQDGTELQSDSLIINDIDVDIIVKVKGGGLIGQADAIKLGLARAFCILENASGEALLRKILKTKGYLTQDSRVKERRKYGLKKARKASQYHKR